LFGEKASLALEGASPRLMRWSQAFDDWLSQRLRENHPVTYRQSIKIWKRFLTRLSKSPWEINQSDLNGYVAWLQAQGYAPASITYELSTLSTFYQWCSQRRIDPASGEGFNPVKGVARPSVARCRNAKVLSRQQACALLAVLKMDQAIITKRDYAFFLARLRLGVPLKKLQCLQWGQIETDEAGAWVTWEGDVKRTLLPEDVHQAIMHYLEAAGRLSDMRSQAYIFAPLADPLKQEATGKAEEWNKRRYLGTAQIRATLKEYGLLVGIPDEVLTLPALRHTAAMLRREAGDSEEAMQAFLDHSRLEYTREYLHVLPAPATPQPPLRDLQSDPPPLPDRRPTIYQPGDGLIHGLYARSQPPEEIAAILAEDIQGLEEEIKALRTLNRALLEMQSRAETKLGLALATNVYTLSAVRLANMIAVQGEFEKRRTQQSWGEAFLARLATSAEERGEIFDLEQVRKDALGDDGLQTGSRKLREEIASTRLMLRRTFLIAMESDQLSERSRLTEIYGSACNRLVKLLKGEVGDQTALENYILEEVDLVRAELIEEWGLNEETT
jgi:site-specific recombinase XerD